MRLLAIPYSTNVERVTLALAHKGLDCEVVLLDPADRSPIVEASGQPLVPVLLTDDGAALADSTAILRLLQDRHPEPPQFPREPARRAEVEVFADWFNRVWKRPPNLIADGDGDPALAAELRGSLDVFEALLAGRDHLFGDDFGVADCLAVPFLKDGLIHRPDDDEPFHRVLIEHLEPGDSHPRLRGWIERVDTLPRAG